MDSSVSILQKISDEINESKICLSTIAFELGIEVNVLKEIHQQKDSVNCFVASLTKRIWYDILHHFKIELENSNVETLPGVQKLFKILYDNKPSGDLTSHPPTELHHFNASELPISDEIQNTEDEKMKEYPHHVSIIDEISQRITEWKQFGRILDLEFSYLNNLETMYQQCSEKVKRFNRNKDIIREAMETFKRKDKPFYQESWKFWRILLMNFDNGKVVIKMMEREFPLLICQVSTDINLKKTIEYLCKNDNVDIFHDFIKIHQLDVISHRGGYDESLLHTSSRMGGLNIIQYLLSQYSFDINVRDLIQRSPLHYASINGNVDVVRYLINNNADINMKNEYGDTPLHIASMYDHVDVVRYLINNNADINIKDDNGDTPLDAARRRNKHEIVRLLKQQISQKK